MGGKVGTDVARGVQVAVGVFTARTEVGVKEGGKVDVNVGKGTRVLVGNGA